MRFGLAARNDPDGVVTVGVTHDQQTPEAIPTQGYKPLLFVIPILNRDCIEVIENRFHLGKVYPMFSDIDAILGRIEDEFHRNNIHTLCRYCNSRRTFLHGQMGLKPATPHDVAFILPEIFSAAIYF